MNHANFIFIFFDAINCIRFNIFGRNPLGTWKIPHFYLIKHIKIVFLVFRFGLRFRICYRIENRTDLAFCRVSYYFVDFKIDKNCLVLFPSVIPHGKNKINIIQIYIYIIQILFQNDYK